MRRPLQTLLTRNTDQDDCHLAIARSASLKYDFDIIRLEPTAGCISRLLGIGCADDLRTELPLSYSMIF